MRKAMRFMLAGISFLLALSIQTALAIQSNVQIDDYSKLMTDYKSALRSYHNSSETDTTKYPIALEGYTVIYILNEDGSPNLQVQEDIKKEIGKVWDDKGRIKVVSWMSKWAYDNFWAPDSYKGRTKTGKTSIDTFNNDHRPWVGVSGELRDYFMIKEKGFILDKEEASVRVAQLQGMPFPYDKNAKKIITDKVFVEFWVYPSDLYRPTRTASIKKDNTPHDLNWRVSDSFNPDTTIYDNAKYQYTGTKWELVSYNTKDTKYPIYINNYQNDIKYHLIGVDGDNLRGGEYGFPFTALGYTYNWHNYNPNNRDCLKDEEHIGTNEFVIKGGSAYEIDGVYETYDYITSEQPHNLLQKEPLQKNYKPIQFEKDKPIPFEDRRLKEAS